MDEIGECATGINPDKMSSVCVAHASMIALTVVGRERDWKALINLSVILAFMVMIGRSSRRVSYGLIPGQNTPPAPRRFNQWVMEPCRSCQK